MEDIRDPTFEPGSFHTATAVFTNTKDAAVSYLIELYLLDIEGIKRASSGVMTLSLDPRESGSLVFSVTMPSIPGDHVVYIDVYVGAVLNVTFVSADIITILAGAQFEVSDLTVTPSEVDVGQPVEISATITNVGDIPGTYTVNCDVIPATYTPLEVAPAITIEISGTIELVMVMMVMMLMIAVVRR